MYLLFTVVLTRRTNKRNPNIPIIASGTAMGKIKYKLHEEWHETLQYGVSVNSCRYNICAFIKVNKKKKATTTEKPNKETKQHPK